MGWEHLVNPNEPLQSSSDGAKGPEPSWTKYRSTEWQIRLQIIEDGLDHDANSRQVAPEYGNVLEATKRSWAYALEDIPTRYLDECFAAALRQRSHDFALTAGAVNRAYDDMLPEIQRRAREQVGGTSYLQLTGPKPEYLGLEEFKKRHNLPPHWRPGDPYPPEGDLA
jgi:hypothetical protein